MDLDTSRKVVYSPSQEWLTRKLSNAKRDRDLQDCFAKMMPSRKAAVLSFINHHVASRGLYTWRLYHIESSQRPLRTQLPARKEPLVVLIFCARSNHKAQEDMHMQRMTEDIRKDRDKLMLIRPDARALSIGSRETWRDRRHNSHGLLWSRRKRSKRVPETKPSDAEIIDQILREYTTFGDDDNALSASVSSAPPLTTTNDAAMPGPTITSPIEQQASMNGGPANVADGGNSDAS